MAKCIAFAPTIADCTGDRECRVEPGAGIRALSAEFKRLPGDNIHSRNQDRVPRHNFFDEGSKFDRGSERPPQPQPCPRVFQCPNGRLGVAARRGTATGGDQVVQLNAGMRSRCPLVEAREIAAVTCFRGYTCRRAAPVIAELGAEVLAGVLLDTDQKVEPIIGEWTKKSPLIAEFVAAAQAAA